MADTAKTTYTLAEAATLLSCHRETLRRAIRDGELRAARLGRGYRISRLDLEAFWIACGGGELFSVQEGQTKEAPQEGAKKKKKGKAEYKQLTLLPTEPKR